MKCFMEVNHYLRLYKEAFTAEAPMAVLGTVLAELCQKARREGGGRGGGGGGEGRGSGGTGDLSCSISQE